MDKIIKEFPNGFSVELVEYYRLYAEWYRSSETETFAWLCKHVQQHWTCIEVGAHIGYTSMLLSTLARRVIAFEPSVTTAEMFEKNVAHNRAIGKGQFDNIELHVEPVGNAALEADETLWMINGDENNVTGEQKGRFKFTTIDEFIAKNPDVKPNLLFVDADGWDFDVLLGSKDTIARFAPVIIIEANYALRWRGHALEEVYKLVDELGYTHTPLDAQCPGNLLLTKVEI